MSINLDISLPRGQPGPQSGLVRVYEGVHGENGAVLGHKGFEPHMGVNHPIHNPLWPGGQPREQGQCYYIDYH